MKSNELKKIEAIRLRVEERCSFNEIIELTGCAKSNLSGWLKPYPLTKDELSARRKVKNQPLPKRDMPILKESSWKTGDKGHYAMLKMQLYAQNMAAIVSLPTIAHCRYDAIIDWNNILYRAQVKYVNRDSTDGSVSVDLGSTTRNGKIISTCYTNDEIDVLLIYIPKIDMVLWIGPELFHGKSSLNIRWRDGRGNNGLSSLIAQDLEWK